MSLVINKIKEEKNTENDAMHAPQDVALCFWFCQFMSYSIFNFYKFSGIAVKEAQESVGVCPRLSRVLWKVIVPPPFFQEYKISIIK